MPRTTLDIDASVLQELRLRSRREHKTIGALVSELAASAFASDAAVPARPLDWRSAPMSARVDLEDKDALYKVLDGR